MLIRDDIVIEIEHEQARRFLTDLAYESNMSPHTIRAYESDLVSLLDFCKRHELQLLELNHKNMRSYLAELSQSRYSKSTIARRLSTVKSFFRFLQAEDLVQANPAELLSAPKLGKYLPRRISPHDMAALLSVHGVRDIRGKKRERSIQDYRDQAILEFMYACGARISEVSRLTIPDIDFAQQQVKLFGKGNKERMVPLHPMAAYTLQSYLDVARPRLVTQKTDTDAVFLSTRGLPMKPDALRKMFKATLEEAGLDTTLTPHDMRHTFASDMLEGGANLRSVQEMLGHVSLSTTQIYTHVALEHLAQVCKAARPRD